MTDTLALETAGWKFQRGYTIEPRFNVAEDERELGNIKSVAVAEKEIRRFPLKYRTNLREAAEYVQSFFRRLVGPAGRFNFMAPEYVATPDAAPVVEAVVSGSQGSRTIYAKYAWKNSNGLTRASPAASIAVPANSLLKVTLPVYPPSVTQAVIYATQSGAGTEQEQTTLTNLKTWIQPNAALLLLTTSPPATNTAKEVFLARCTRYTVTRLDGIAYELDIEIEETY